MIIQQCLTPDDSTFLTMQAIDEINSQLHSSIDI